DVRDVGGNLVELLPAGGPSLTEVPAGDLSGHEVGEIGGITGGHFTGLLKDLVVRPERLCRGWRRGRRERCRSIGGFRRGRRFGVGRGGLGHGDGLRLPEIGGAGRTDARFVEGEFGGGPLTRSGASDQGDANRRLLVVRIDLYR